MNSPGESLEAGNVTSGGRPVVLLRLTSVLTAKVGADGGQELFNVELLDLVIDIDVVLVEDLGVVEGPQDGLLDSIREEGVFVRRLKSPNEGLELLLLLEVPVQEA